MRFEDIGKIFEDAISRVEPVDEVQREKLARLRERIAAANQEMVAEVTKAKEEMDGFYAKRSNRGQAIAKERAMIAEEALTAMTESFGQHADVIKRIAKSAGKSR